MSDPTTPAETPTPRTDAAQAMVCVPFEREQHVLIDYAVPSTFARQLERELAAAWKQAAYIERLQVEQHAALAAALAAKEQSDKRADEFKRIGQGFERDMRNHFEQSCKNLRRAEAAENELEALKRGEFICKRCGVRKDAESDGDEPNF